MFELLYLIGDWLGFDLRGPSRPRIIAAALYDSILGLVALIAGVYLMTHHDDDVAVLTGIVCVVLGFALLGRVGVNVAAILRRPKT